MSKLRIKVFELLDVSELHRYYSVLPVWFFELPKDVDRFVFDISSISGWIYYANHDELGKNKTSRLLPKSEFEILKIVNRFLENSNKRLEMERLKNEKFPLIHLFPSTLGKPTITPVFNSHNDTFDHLLVKFHPVIKNSSNFYRKPITVLGSSVEFRIGNNGKIIGFSSNWRPILRSQYKDLIPPDKFPKVDSQSGGHSHSHHTSDNEILNQNIDTLDEDQSLKLLISNSELELTYFDKGEGVFQNFLTPNYVFKSGHHFEFQPASSFSLVIDIIEDHYHGNADIYAKVLGGSGFYDIQWASWKIEEGESSFIDHGNLKSITLEIGSYTVSLTVQDRRSGVIEQMKSLVYVHSDEIERQNFLIT